MEEQLDKWEGAVLSVGEGKRGHWRGHWREKKKTITVVNDKIHKEERLDWIITYTSDFKIDVSHSNYWLTTP